jgi:hypothetical protein
MAAKRSKVSVTANFEANLAAIEKFLAETSALAAYDTLLNDLTEQLIPALENHPEIGRSFIDRKTHSVEALRRIKQLTSRVGAMSLREFIAGDFLVLYAVKNRSIYLLSIKHQRQLSFDLHAHWH